MRMPRRRFLIALALALSVVLFFHFHVYYRICGLFRGDAFYKGLPTCYWAEGFHKDQGMHPWLKSVFSFLGLNASQSIGKEDVFCNDPGAADVLLQIAADANLRPSPREKAIRCLDHYHHPHARELARICAQIFKTGNQDRSLRTQVEYTLMGLAAARKTKEIDFEALLHSSDFETKEFAAGALWARGENRELLGPLLVEFIEKHGTNAHFAPHALMFFSDKENVPFLVVASHHQDRLVRWALILALRGFVERQRHLDPAEEPMKSALERLSELAADDSDPELREQAAKAFPKRAK